MSVYIVFSPVTNNTKKNWKKILKYLTLCSKTQQLSLVLTQVHEKMNPLAVLSALVNPLTWRFLENTHFWIFSDQS